MEEKTNGIKKLFESDKARKIIVIIGIIGIALIFISSISGINTDKKTETEGFSVTTYSTEIESDLQKILSSISGCGETKVLLTIENSVEYVYLEDSTTKTKEIQPVIRGVLVVCEGGDDPVVTQTVTQAVTRALDISSAKVCVTKLTERRYRYYENSEETYCNDITCTCSGNGGLHKLSDFAGSYNFTCKGAGGSVICKCNSRGNSNLRRGGSCNGTIEGAAGFLCIRTH